MKGKKRMRLKARIMLIVYIPLGIMAIGMLLALLVRTQKTVHEELNLSLTATATAVKEVFDSYPGKYWSDQGGKVHKGGFCISDAHVIVDKMKSESECEMIFFFDNKRNITSFTDEEGNRITGTEFEDQSIIERVMINGETVFVPQMFEYDKNYFAVFTPVYQYQSDEIVAMVFVGLPTDKVNKEIIATSLIALGIAVLLFVGSGIVISISVNSICKSIKSSVDAADAVAKGDMTKEISEKALNRSDEIGDVCKALNNVKSSLSKTIGNILEKNKELDDTSELLVKMVNESGIAITHVDNAINDIANGATAQAEDTTRASEQVAQIGNVIENTSANIDKMTAMSENMSAEGKKTSDIFEELSVINGKVAEAIGQIRTQINETNESAKEIGKATKMIQDIASQTNLLSLNAAIEAARAGEAGRGFAVVAAEIQNLSEQSNNSSKEIERITKVLTKNMTGSVSLMNEVDNIIAKQSEELGMAGSSFKTVENGIVESLNCMNEISRNMEDMNRARAEILDTVSNLTAIAQENAASSEETSASTTQVRTAVEGVEKASDDLQKIVEVIDNTMSNFTV